MEVRRMVRGKREPGHRGGEGFRGRGGRGSNDERLEPDEPENDPFCNLRDDDEELPDPANEEYIWPTIEDEEDD